MAENYNIPLVNVLAGANADVLRQIFIDITKQLNEINIELEKLKQKQNN